MEYHVIDAFTDKLFSGNPAGVCLLDGRIDDDIMQNIATENNLSETAFLLKQADGRYGLRWFTPTVEVDLCGHATLASAFVLFDDKEKDVTELRFDTASGELIVTRDVDLLCLNFPSSTPKDYPLHLAIGKAFGVEPVAVFESIDFLVLVENEETLRRLSPDFSALRELASDGNIPGLDIIVTAPGTDCDFVSRYFAPEAGVPEDPVTGRAHCTLTPFWSKKLGKKIMDARQLSKRGGVLQCEDYGDRVKISGRAVRYLKGTIEL